jgi:chromosome segregation ATPase
MLLPTLGQLNQLSGPLVALCSVLVTLGAVLAWSQRRLARRWLRTGQLALSKGTLTAAQRVVDESQQLTISNLKTALDSVTVRLRVLEDTIKDKDKAHAADMELLRGELHVQLAQKDKIIAESQARITELETKVETQSAELQQARADLATYSQKQLRKEEAAARAATVAHASREPGESGTRS